VAATYEIFEDRGVAVVTFAGEVHDGDVLRCFTELAADPRMRRDFALLLDVREQAIGTVSSDGVRSFATRPPPVSDEARKAVLVATDFGHGMTRMFNLRLGDEKRGFAIFRDEGEARRYVGLEPE
jgi:hypothetical protein